MTSIHRRIARLGALALCIITACSDRTPVGPVQTTATPDPEPSLVLVSKPDKVTNRYIVMFKPEVANASSLAAQLVKAHGGQPFKLYEHAIKGFAIANLSTVALTALRSSPLVAAVEEDVVLHPQDVVTLPSDSYNTQQSSLWGLDRIDERAPIFDGQRTFFARGTGVHVYIVDSGFVATTPSSRDASVQV
jgi:large repetitive protein